MPITVNIQVSTIGIDAGPFTINDGFTNVASGISRLDLLGGIQVTANDLATDITITSTGNCLNSLVIPIDSQPCGDEPPPPPPPRVCKENVELNVTDTGWIKYYNCDTSQVEYQFINTTGSVILTNCVDIDTIDIGIPYADVASFTVVSTGVDCTTPPPPPPTYYYYSGTLCGGATTEYFRSTESNLADNNLIVRAWCASCGGGSEQCFDNISVSLVENTNDVIATFPSCEACATNTVNVTSVYGFMEPCIGGTIDDYMGAAIFLDATVSVDTSFDIVVNYVNPGDSCGGFTSSQYFTLVLTAGSSSGFINACTEGAYFPSGALICSACINYCDNPNVDISSYTC